MGQKCCKPAMRVDKKHKFLLNLIYKETRQNVSNLNHRQISEYLAKKGYIKTLCDYLSSHLNQISPSVSYCKDQQQQVWKQQPKIQLFYCCITGEILIKIVKLCKQVKMKHMSKSKKLGAQQDAEEMNSRIKSSLTEKVASKVSELKKSQKRRTHDEYHEAHIYLEQQVTSSMIIETCNQMLKQTILSKSPSNSQKSMLSNQSRAELTDHNEYHILTKVQNILFVLLQNQDSPLKIDNTVLKQILDSQIYIAVQDANKASQQISMKRNYTNRNSQQAPNPYVLQNIVKSPNKLQRQSRQFQIGNANSKTELLRRKAFPHFNFHQQEFQRLRIASLKNYEMLFKKYNSQLVSTSLYKNVVKQHLPLLLERWTKLIIGTDDQENSLSLSGISEKINESIFSSKGVTQAKNEKNLKTIEKLINSIILEFFSGYFSFGESEYLYRQLTLIFDKLYFSRSKIQPIEQLVFKALKKFDLRQSVVSKWFEYLLNYLGIITTINYNQNSSGTLNDKRVNQQQESTNYLSQMNINLNFNTDNIDYVHWSNQESIVGCLRTIQRWIQLKQVVLEDILMLKRTKFFVAILCNLAWGQNKISQQIYNIICFLVSQDIRCQGYLVSTSIYLIQRAKVNKNSQGQEEWDFFYNGWKKKHYSIRFKQNQSESSRLIKQNDKEKQNLNAKSRNLRLTLKETDLINIQHFLDQVICLACYPFLTELFSRISDDSPLGIEEQASHMPAGSQIQNQLIFARRQSEQIRRSETGVKNLQHRSSLITSNNDFIKEKPSQIKIQEILETHYNFYLAKKQVFFFVFEQIIQILFGQIHFQGGSRTSECLRRIKLCGLFLVSNFATMMALISKSKVEKQKLGCVFNITNKINNFMAKVCHQLRVTAQNQEGSNYKQTYDSQSLYSHNRLEISKQMNGMQDSIDKLPKHRRRQKKLSFLSSSIHKWIYPAFSHILLPTEFEKIFLSKQNLNQDQITTILQSKILLNFSVKLYFINLVNLVLENYEGYHIARGSRKAGEDGSESGKQKRNSNFFNIGDNDDNMNRISEDSINKHQKWFILNFFAPIIEIYQLMLDFNQKSNMYKQTKTFMVQKEEQKKQVITSKTEKGQKQNKSKGQQKNRKLDDIKLEKNLQEMIWKIKKNRQDYKMLYKKQSNNDENRQKSGKFANSFLDGITHVQQYQIDQYNGNQPSVSEQHVLNEAESIISDQNICPYMFYLVDFLTKQALNFYKSDDDALVFDNQATFKKGQNYLMKQLRKVVIVEEVEVRSKCDWFKRSNKKQSKVYKVQNSGIKQQKNFLNSLQKTADTKFSQDSNSELLWLPLLKNQETEQAIQRIIQKFEQKYKVGNISKGRNIKQASSSGATKLSGWLHISQGDFQMQQSSHKSSQLDSRRVEQNSLKQVLQQIRKH